MPHLIQKRCSRSSAETQPHHVYIPQSHQSHNSLKPDKIYVIWVLEDQAEGQQLLLNPIAHHCLWEKHFAANCQQVAEKAMAPHSSTLAWKIPWMEEPGGLQSMGSLRVRHGWATSLSLFTFTHWRRKWQPTPVFLPGEPQGRGSLLGCCLWGRTESDTTEAT